MTDTLYAELLWIARNAKMRDGWAWFRYQEMTGAKPVKDEMKAKPMVPGEKLVALSKAHMSQFSYNKLMVAYERARMTPAERDAKKAEAELNRRFKDKAYWELDGKRPRLENL